MWDFYRIPQINTSSRARFNNFQFFRVLDNYQKEQAAIAFQDKPCTAVYIIDDTITYLVTREMKIKIWAF